jgi:hypothetical protein
MALVLRAVDFAAFASERIEHQSVIVGRQSLPGLKPLTCRIAPSCVQIKTKRSMIKKKLFGSLVLSLLLVACGGGSGGGAVIGISDENTDVSIGSDLSLTVRVDPGKSSGFTTRVGPDGARISLNSGQRLEISADRPATLQLESNGATVNLASTDGRLWEGELNSPVKTSVRFRFTALDRPDRHTTLTVDVTP